MCHEVEQGPIEPEEEAELSIAELPGALHDGVEHRLHVGRRAGDDPQNLCGGGMLVPRLTEGTRDLRV
jgi:hypothetical protein